MRSKILDTRWERKGWDESDLLLSREEPFHPTVFAVEYIDPGDGFAYLIGPSTLEESLAVSERHEHLASQIKMF